MCSILLVAGAVFYFGLSVLLRLIVILPMELVLKLLLSIMSSFVLFMYEIVLCEFCLL